MLKDCKLHSIDTNYENRIIFLSDALPKMVQKFAENKQDTNDNDDEYMNRNILILLFLILCSLSESELRWYHQHEIVITIWSVNSSSEFMKMHEEFDFTVTPLVFNV